MSLSFSTSKKNNYYYNTNTTTTTRRDWIRALAMERSEPPAPAAVPNSNYVVPMDSNSPSCITRPLAEILRDLNKRIPDNIITKSDDHLKNSTPFIPWLVDHLIVFYITCFRIVFANMKFISHDFEFLNFILMSWNCIKSKSKICLVIQTCHLDQI